MNAPELMPAQDRPPDPNTTLANETRIPNLNFNDLFSELYFRTLNDSNCTFENGTCSDVSYNYWALSLLVFPLLTLFGNVLVIMSVAREKSLQTATNYFIVSLAVADLLVAVVVMPFGVYYLFNGAWGLPALVCDCYIAMDVTCSTSSIFNLVAISVDRYIAVTQPIKYAKHKSNSRVWSMICLAWLVSGGIGSPIVLGLNDSPERNEDQCLFNNTDYVIYSSLGSFYLPCLIMMFLYYNIFKERREPNSVYDPNSIYYKSNIGTWSMICLAWLVSDGIGSPVMRGLNNSSERNEDQCLFNNTDYVIYWSLGSFYLPCLIMMFLYYNIFKAIRQRAKKQRSAKSTSSGIASASSGTAAVVIENLAQTTRLQSTEDKPTNTASASGSNEDEEDDNFDRTEMGVYADELATTRSARFMLAAVVEETGLIMANLASPIPMMDPNTNNDSGYAPSNIDGDTKDHSPPASPKDKKKGENGAPKPKPELKKKLSRLSSSSVISTPRRRFRSAASAARFTIFRANRAGKLRAKSFAKKEKKATQTLAIVLGVFLVCWAPFFTCSVFDAICTKLGLPYGPGVTVFILTTWLGYINSFLNPVIYTIFNPEFRKAFRKILHCGT